MQLSHNFTRAVPFLFVGLWSTGFIGARWGLPYIEPFNFLFIRMLLTLLAFLGLILWFKAKWPTLEQSGHQLVTGSLIHAGYLGGVFAAIKLELPAGVAAIIVGLQPLLTAFLSKYFLGQSLSRRGWVGLWLGLFGVLLVLGSGVFEHQFEVHPGALAAALVALFSITIGTLYQKRYGKGVNLLTASFMQYVATAIWMGALTFTFETREIIWDPHLMGALAWLVFGLSVSAILLLLFMIREGESAKVASYFYLVPMATTVEAWLLFNEQLSILALAGIAVTVMGVYQTQRAITSKA
jgi:drug/metabolite transporter (DMT)-like permease